MADIYVCNTCGAWEDEPHRSPCPVAAPIMTVDWRKRAEAAEAEIERLTEARDLAKNERQAFRAVLDGIKRAEAAEERVRVLRGALEDVRSRLNPTPDSPVGYVIGQALVATKEE